MPCWSFPGGCIGWFVRLVFWHSLVHSFSAFTPILFPPSLNDVWVISWPMIPIIIYIMKHWIMGAAWTQAPSTCTGVMEKLLNPCCPLYWINPWTENDQPWGINGCSLQIRLTIMFTATNQFDVVAVFMDAADGSENQKEIDISIKIVNLFSSPPGNQGWKLRGGWGLSWARCNSINRGNITLLIIVMFALFMHTRSYFFKGS